MNFKHLIESTFDHALKNIVPLIILTLVFVGLSTISLGILAPVMFAGYTASVLNMVRTGKEPSPKDVFSHIHLFLPLALFGIALVIVAAIGFLLLVLPGLIFLLAVMFFLIYMIPIMVDQESGLIDSIKKSISMVKQTDLFDHIIFIVIYAVIQAIGGSTLLGLVITMPLSTLFLVLVYDAHQN
jgi:uncharacterized membrane protein